MNLGKNKNLNEGFDHAVRKKLHMTENIGERVLIYAVAYQKDWNMSEIAQSNDGAVMQPAISKECTSGLWRL